MKPFMDRDFLLHTDTARSLYHDVAEKLPICDFHCHISPEQIAKNMPFRSITEAWLGGDHYKWRAMRIAGVPERLITGDAPDEEKFVAWADVVSQAIGNPLYHWTHLELQAYFDIHEPLTTENAHDIYAACNRRLQQGMRPQEIIRQSNVKLLCTTDDPVDDLIYHHQLRQENTSGAMILPAWRPDKALNLSLPTFAPWLARLEAVTAQRIDTFEALQEALTQRALFFHEQGCRLSDHGMDTVPCEYASMAEVETAFAAGRAGKPLTQRQVDQYRTALLVFLAGLYRNLGWTMQLHIGATRNVNHARAHVLGPDTGFDAMGDTAVAQPLEGLLNAMAQKTPLPRTILFNIHAKDNYTLATLAGTFQQDGVAAQVQHGPAWWFHDQRDGMLLQMTNLANVSLLSEFIGMTTDSRSLLSYTRHAYFRRILCNLLGDWVEAGEYPNDRTQLIRIVHKVCYENAMGLFANLLDQNL